MSPPPHHRTWGDLLRPFVKFCQRWLQPWPEAIWGQIWTSRRTPPRSSQEIRSSWLVNKCHNHVFCFWSHETSSTKLIPSANMEGGFEYGGSFFSFQIWRLFQQHATHHKWPLWWLEVPLKFWQHQSTPCFLFVKRSCHCWLESSLVKRSVSWCSKSSKVLFWFPFHGFIIICPFVILCLYICGNTHFRHTDVRWLSYHVDFYIPLCLPFQVRWKAAHACAAREDAKNLRGLRWIEYWWMYQTNGWSIRTFIELKWYSMWWKIHGLMILGKIKDALWTNINHSNTWIIHMVV